MLASERAHCSERLKYVKKSGIKSPSTYHKSNQEKYDTTFNKKQVDQKPIKRF